MKENTTSRTAISAAFYRAYHALYDEPKIFNDFLAAHFLGESEVYSLSQEMIGGFRAAAPELAISFPNEDAILAFMMQAMAAPSLTLSRARYAEEQLEIAAARGIQQYVSLGAGMDTFAFRRSDLLEDLQVFELDHPATQTYKRQRMAELKWEQPHNLQFVPIDFNEEKLANVLKNTPYDSKKPAFFSWLGVSYYLPRQTVLSAMHDIAANAAPRSLLVFDYLDREAFIPEKAAKRVQVLLILAHELGETMQMGFDPSTLDKDLKAAGLQLIEDLYPAEIQKRYFNGRADKYYACEHAHFVCAEIK